MGLYCIKEICLIKIPKKKKRNKSNIPKERKRLLNRTKMLKTKKRRKQVERNKEKIRDIETSILETELKLKEHREQEINTKEEKVIDNMKDNSKIFFNYIKEQKDKDTQIGPFKTNKEYISD